MDLRTNNIRFDNIEDKTEKTELAEVNNSKKMFLSKSKQDIECHVEKSLQCMALIAKFSSE